jgi:hypothetical protein
MALRNIYESGFDEVTGKTTDEGRCPEYDNELITESGET